MRVWRGTGVIPGIFLRQFVMVQLLNRIAAHHVSHVVERDLSFPIEGGDTPDGFTWRLATPGDFASDDATLRLNSGRRQFALSMLKAGAVCLIAEHDGERAHIRWVTFGRLQTIPFDIALGPGWAYVHRVRTAPRFRGMGPQGRFSCFG
jgi:hypothetical protein